MLLINKTLASIERTLASLKKTQDECRATDQKFQDFQNSSLIFLKILKKYKRVSGCYE